MKVYYDKDADLSLIKGKKVTIVPILRAGLGMLDGVLDMVPNAKVSVVGLSRNHQTLQPETYFERLVGHLDERTALIIDPMLATAGSMIATVDLLKARGCRDIRALVFPNDSRTLMDIRRSGALEASAGTVDPKALADVMGNTIAQSKALQRTYTPAQIATASTVPEARRRGRQARSANEKGS